MATHYSIISRLRSECRFPVKVPGVSLVIDRYRFQIPFHDADVPFGSICFEPAASVLLPRYVAALGNAFGQVNSLSDVARVLTGDDDVIHFSDHQVERFASQVSFALTIPEWEPYHNWLLWLKEALLLDIAPEGVNPGYVYLVQSPSRFFKIGKTKDPQDRLRTFEVKLPFEVRYLSVIRTLNMTWLEKHLHSRFGNRRAHGEWFALDEWEIEFIQRLAL